MLWRSRGQPGGGIKAAGHWARGWGGARGEGRCGRGAGARWGSLGARGDGVRGERPARGLGCRLKGTGPALAGLESCAWGSWPHPIMDLGEEPGGQCAGREQRGTGMFQSTEVKAQVPRGLGGTGLAGEGLESVHQRERLRGPGRPLAEPV